MLGLALSAVVLALDPASGIMVRQDVEDVPVDRVIANLEKLAEKEPQVVEYRVNLARAHVMAFALKSGTIAIARDRASLGPANPPLRENVQPTVKPATDPGQIKAAQDHLSRALQRYEEAIAIAPSHALARLGYGWALEQSGATARAIAAYRSAIDLAWEKERRPALVKLQGWQSITEEATRYLIPLLDPVKDQKEIEILRARVAEVQRVPRAITPIVVPLRAGLTAMDLVDRAASVAFDADGTGLRGSWTWIKKDAGWLVFDPRGRGDIRSSLQMFGSVTFWLFWNNGYDAMRALDDDLDGRLRGKELAGLAIWRDANSNGASEPGEVKPLREWRIVELSCTYTFDEMHPEEIPVARTGVTFEDGSTRPTFDVWLRRVAPLRLTSPVESDVR
jgi:tetratricopeptide (TPR) repeat protein